MRRQRGDDEVGLIEAAAVQVQRQLGRDADEEVRDEGGGGVVRAVQEPAEW